MKDYIMSTDFERIHSTDIDRIIRLEQFIETLEFIRIGTEKNYFESRCIISKEHYKKSIIKAQDEIDFCEERIKHYKGKMGIL